MPAHDEPLLSLRVEAARRQGERITSYELAPLDGSALPQWTPGAHLDVRLPSGTVRQYSLCGDPADRSRYRIGVLEIPHGRGGSVEVHREFRPGVAVAAAAPRNDFTLVEADHYVFIAGGIGITPLLPMVEAVESRGAEWSLHYGARSREHFAFLDELARHDDRVHLVAEDIDGRLDMGAVLAGAAGALIYCCGPAPLLEAVENAVHQAGEPGALHIERFAPAVVLEPDGNGFEVELARTGTVVEVSAGVSILEAVRAAGVEQASSCEMGICGTCETKVLLGQVDHRDNLLTDSEKVESNTMMICVSRAFSPRLVLDL